MTAPAAVRRSKRVGNHLTRALALGGLNSNFTHA